VPGAKTLSSEEREHAYEARVVAARVPVEGLGGLSEEQGEVVEALGEQGSPAL
jgi:hypothetical protein